MTRLGWRAMAVAALAGAGVLTFVWARYAAETVIKAMTGVRW